MNFKTLSDLYSHLDIKGLEYHDSHNIGQLFKELRDFYKRKKEKSICQWEIDVFSFSIRDNLLQPFISYTSENGIINEYPSLKNFDDQAFFYIKKRLETCVSPNIKAHYAHFLWLSPEKHRQFANIAIDSYLAAIKSFQSIPLSESKDIDLQIRQFLRNAYMLTKSIRAKPGPIVEIVTELIQKFDPNNLSQGYFLLALSQLVMSDFKIFYSPQIINTFIEKLSSTSSNLLKSDEYEQAIDIIKVQIVFENKIEKPIKSLLITIAECWEKLANNRKDDSNMVVLEFLRSALEIYKKIKDIENIKRIEKKILESKDKLNLKQFSQTIDITSQVKVIRKAADKLTNNNPDVILSVLSLDKSIIPSKKTLKEQTNRSKKENPLQYIVSTQIYDKRGNTVQHFVSDEELFFNGILKTLGYIQKLSINIVLREIIFQGIKKRKLTAKNFIEFLRNNTWLGFNIEKVSPGGDKLVYNWIDQISPSIFEYFNNMDAYFYDQRHYPNMILPIDSLTLKIEGLIRDLCEILKITTFYTELDNHNKTISKEKDLNALLRDQSLNYLLDPDDLFFLRYLFIEKAGNNLRNDVAHSLLISEEYTIDKFHLILLSILRLGKYNLSPKK